MRIAFVFLLLFSFGKSVFGQNPESQQEELENFVVITDQDFYLAGDRIWFGAKLLKNHDSYRYSKLAYISLLDHTGKKVFAEKMLLSGQDMVFGDIFLPENASSGVYSLLVYTKWMSNFEDFPVAKKDFLVINSKVPKVEGVPVIFVEKTPFQNQPYSLIHTSIDSELIEIQSEKGETLEIIEAVPALHKFQIKADYGDNIRLIFRNETYSLAASPWIWDPLDFSLRSIHGKQEGLKLTAHTGWTILEEMVPENGFFRLNRSKYQNLEYFDISVLDQSDKVIWSYRVQNSSSRQGQMAVASKGNVRVPFKVDFAGLSKDSRDVFLLAKATENTTISDWVKVLNDPNWQILGGNSRVSTLPLALINMKSDSPDLKDFSPMFDYKPWAIDEAKVFPTMFSPQSFSFEIPDEILEKKLNRKIYREYYEIGEEVVELESPFVPDKIYYLEEYDEFSDLESFVKQIIPQVRLKKTRGVEWKEILLANTDNQHVKFDKVPLVLIDFYTVVSLEEVWALDISRLDRVEIFYHRETVQKTNLGEKVGDGLIVIYTKNNEYAMKKNLPKSRYFLSDVQVPRRPDHGVGRSLKISANPLQYLLPGLEVYRGRAKASQLEFDTAGEWRVESWVFGNGYFSRFEKSIAIDP
jgi:hypothetical protein